MSDEDQILYITPSHYEVGIETSDPKEVRVAVLFRLAERDRSELRGLCPNVQLALALSPSETSRLAGELLKMAASVQARSTQSGAKH